ncbi:hypothetical protein BGZ83_002438 [Gryganskiella cystojenkinii]|nr:hypothetical protein BGZ83_002438 [Gryganskiella cystojenkinii]
MSASMVKSPLQQFPESERVVSEEGDSDADQEPELNAFVRPSQLRASLMERAKKSNQRIKTRSASMPLEQGLRLSIQSNQSLNSAYESRPSARSSMSSTISGWARARSSSVSSQESSGSVNLEALIAEGSDINEECPLDLEEGDDLEWSREQQQQQSRMQQPRSRNQIQTMSQSKCVSGEIPMQQVENQTAEENWDEYLSESDMVTEEDQEFGQTLKSFSQIALKSSTSSGVRGLGYSGLPTKLSTPTSAASRFAEGRNPYDLDGDSMETPSGLRDPRAGNRLSTVSTSSNTSSTSGRGVGNGSKLLAPGASRLPASGLKAPASRLVPPAATRSGLTQPKATSSAASKTGVGLTRPSGLPAPKSGLQAPKAAGSSAARSGVAKPAGGSGVAGPGRTGSLPRAASVGGLGKMATTTATGTARTGVPRTGSTSQLAAPLTIRRPGTGPSGISSIAVGNTAAKRQSLLPSATSASTSRISAPPGRLPAPGTRANSTRQNSIGSTLQLTSPSRLTSGRPASTTTYMVSPTSSQSSTSSMRSIPHDTVTPLSQRLSNATGTTTLPSASRLTKPGAGQRAVSMYGSNSRLYSVEREPEALTYQQEEEEEEDYSVLTPPQSPSSNKNVPGIGRSLGGIPRSGLKPPSASGSSSRLVPPSVTTTKSPRPSSPSPLSAGSNSSVGSNSFLARPRTPTSNGNLTTSSIPSYGSRLPTGLVSPRVGRH